MRSRMLECGGAVCTTIFGGRRLGDRAKKNEKLKEGIQRLCVGVEA